MKKYPYEDEVIAWFSAFATAAGWMASVVFVLGLFGILGYSLAYLIFQHPVVVVPLLVWVVLTVHIYYHKRNESLRELIARRLLGREREDNL